MNIVKIYVTNIQSVERVPNLDFCLYDIVCDTDCWGAKRIWCKNSSEWL